MEIDTIGMISARKSAFFSKRVQRGGGVMMWAAFCRAERLPMKSVGHRLDSIRYQELLQLRLAPFYNRRRRNRHEFMQDNAPCHASRSTMNWLNQRNIRVLEWPSNSPDLNPIENLWGIMVRHIYAEGRQYQSIAALQQAWNDINQETIDNLILSMDNRMFQVINRNGGQTDY